VALEVIFELAGSLLAYRHEKSLINQTEYIWRAVLIEVVVDLSHSWVEGMMFTSLRNVRGGAR